MPQHPISDFGAAHDEEQLQSQNQGDQGKFVTVQCGSHLKSPTELTAYPVFPPNTKSLLCKYLSEDMWNKYKDSYDSCGFTFK
jgi:hypothetical protein